MKIAEHMKAELANADPVWAEASAYLAQAIIERAAHMSPSELRAFVGSTAAGTRFVKAGDNELNATVAIVPGALI